MIKDIHTTAGTGSIPAYLTAVGSTVYFQANDGTGYELWKSDGTFAGTVQVKDINTTSGTASSSPANLTNVGGTLYFTASDGVNGTELWKSSGTSGTTTMVVDLYPGATSSSPAYLTAISTTCYFRANDGSGYELWKSNGTAGTTLIVKDIWSGNSGSGPANFTYVGSTMFFTADDGVNGVELWKSDGTTGGTALVKDIRPGSSSSSPANLFAYGSTLYFSANDGTNGVELWKSDGTNGGTVMVKDINTTAGASSSPYSFGVVGSTILFRANDGVNGAELWKTDGTSINTVLVRNINTTAGASSNPFGMKAMGSYAYFTATDGVNGTELWRSDGTFAGTTMVKNVDGGSGSSYPFNLTVIGSTLFYQAYDATNGGELWKSDGTSAGSVVVKDINPGTADSYPDQLTVVGSILYFQAYTVSSGYELWKSDGTLAGTVMVKEIRAGTSSSSPNNLINFGGTLYFAANDGTNGSEFWKSDGTSGGTVMAKDINSFAASSPSYMVVNSGRLYFIANDGTGNNVWVTDGRECATIMVTPYPGIETASPYYLVAGGSKLYFSMVAQGYDREPFVVDPALVSLPVNTSISAHPASITRYLTNSAPFSVTANGTNLTYQWKKNTVDISGQTNSTYTIASVTSSDAASYTVQVDGTCGTVLSNAATLTVHAADPSAQPTSLNFTSPTTTGFTVSWTAAAGAPTGYLVIRKLSSSPTGIPVDGTVYSAGNAIGDGTVAYVGTGTTFNETSLSSNTTYAYDIYSYNGSSSTSTLINYLTSAAPLEGSRTTLASQPTAQATGLVFGSITTTGFSVSWTAATGAPSGYLVVRRSGTSPTGTPTDGTAYSAGNALGDGTVAYSGSAVTFNETTLSAGTTYHYDVFSFNGSGQAINYLTTSPLENSQGTLPAAPVATAATSVTQTSFTATWNASIGATSYRLDVSTDNFSSFVTGFNNKTVSGTSDNVTGLSAGTTHQYRVRAVSGVGTSANSSTITQITKPADPGNLIATVPTLTGFTLNWDAVAGATSYQVEVDDNNDFSSINFNSTPVTNAALVVSTLNAGVNYFIRVRAVNAAGASGNTSITKLTLPPTPTLNDASAIQSTSFLASWSVSGSPVIDGYEIEVSADNFATFVAGYGPKVISSASTQEAVSPLTPSTSFKFRVRSTNASGKSPNSIEKSVTTQTPSFTPINLGAVTVTGHNVSVGITNGDPPFTYVKIMYKGITSQSSSFAPKNMTGTTGTFSTDVSAEIASDPVGLEFYIEANDDGTIVDNKNGNSGKNFFVFRLYGEGALSLNFTAGGGVTNYQMFSIPADLSPDDDIADIFDEMGAYDKTKWRLFHWDPATTRYIEYEAGLQKIKIGEGYWFNSKSAATISTNGGTAYKGSEFKMDLKKGWNQIGNPYNFTVNWLDVRQFNGNTTAVGDLSAYTGGQYVTDNNLQAFEGAFVFADPAIELTIPAIIKDGLGGRKQNESPWAIKERSLDRPQWLVPLTLRQGNSINSVTGFGMHPEAAASKDAYDAMTVPRFLDYLENNFYHGEYFYPRFSRDIVPTQETYTWEMVVESNHEGEVAQLEWNPTELGQNNMTLFLYDPEQGLKINMKEVGVYKFPLKEKRTIQFYFSREGSPLIPDRATIGKAYPNPFSNRVFIPFTLGNDLPEYKTKIVVTDLLGREVGTIADETFAPGFHEVTWNGNDRDGHSLRQGVYLVRFRIEGNSCDRFARVVLQR
ncbi:MAG: ELWxxDGT repeat protein [Bacteroidota bacterium]